MSARSRKPDTESLGIESSSVLASSRLQTGVLPFFTTYFGPRTECAGFDGVICLTTRKSYSIRTAASFCLMVGLDPGKSSIQGSHMERSHGREFQAVSSAPVKKLPASAGVSLPGIPVTDRGREEVDVGFGDFGAGRSNQRREPGLGRSAGHDREFSFGNRFHMGPLLYHIKEVMFYTSEEKRNHILRDSLADILRFPILA